MKTTDCFHAASLADLWDRLEEGETGTVAAPGAMFVPRAPEDAAPQNKRRDAPRPLPREPDRITVSMKKSAMILMRKTVLVALEMDPAGREEFLARMQAQYFDDAKRAKASESKAREWSEYLVQRVRKTIQTIERPGSTDGRNA